MTYKVNISMCGDAAKEDDAKNVVEYLARIGIDAEYAEAADNRHYDGREPTDAEWKEAMDYAVSMGISACSLAESWLADYLANNDTSAEEAALSRRGADVSELRDFVMAYGLNEKDMGTLGDEEFDRRFKACATAIAAKLEE